jgi:preprotein translocase subunit SecD
MNRNLLWRGLLILAIVGVLAFAAFPLDENLKLGLDLQGGMHLVMQVKGDEALNAETDTAMTRTVRLLEDEADITGARAEKVDSLTFAVLGVPESRDGEVAEIYDDFLSDAWLWDREGDRLVCEMREGYESETRRQAERQASQTIGNRVTAYGAVEPLITTQADKERLIIQLPGVPLAPSAM